MSPLFRKLALAPSMIGNRIAWRPGALAGHGTQRLALLGGASLLVIAGAIGVVLWGQSQPPESVVGTVPLLNSTPGGDNIDPRLQQLAREQAQRAAAQAQAEKTSHFPNLNNATAALPAPARTAASTPAPAAATPAPDLLADRTTEQVTLVDTAAQEKPPEVDAEATKRYKSALELVMGNMGAKAASYELVTLPKEEAAPKARQGISTPASYDAATSADGITAASGPAVGRRTVMPAYRWVQGKVVNATNTDSSGPVLVEIRSGPLTGERIEGTAQRHRDRMTVTMTQMFRNGEKVPIRAVLMSAATKETAVASRVDHHIGERIILPTLAATVSGLGQALALSGSSRSYGSFGGSSSFSNFSPAQLAGIAAGGGAQQLTQILSEMAPRSLTAYLDADAEVGVMFLDPVTE